jgi:hypothetical protein
MYAAAGSWNLKEKTLDLTPWRTRFRRGSKTER